MQEKNTAPLSTIFLAAAMILAGYIWFALPHEREVESLGLLLFKLLPFAAATFGIALLPLDLLRRLRAARIGVPLSFAVFFCIFVPKIFWHADNFPELYYTMLTASPYLILSLTAAFRLGGGSTEEVVRLSFAMLLLMLSGLEDLAFLTINPHTDPAWTPIPEVWTWASHIAVFLGHPPTKLEAYAFIAVHLLLAALVLFVPLPSVRRLAATGPAMRQQGEA